MKWPRDGKPCPTGDGLLRRVAALREPDPPPMPWETRFSVWLFRVKRRFRRRRRGTPVS